MSSDNIDESQEQSQAGLGAYEGERNELKERHGRGKNIFPNGDIFDGQYSSGKRNGNGEYQFTKKKAKYTGEYKDGLKHGQGELLYPDGSKYSGSFVRGKKHGQGTYTYPNGDVYMGEWEADKKHGKGVYKFVETGISKEANWIDGQVSGIAEFTFPDHVAKVNYAEGKAVDQVELSFPALKLTKIVPVESF